MMQLTRGGVLPGSARSAFHGGQSDVPLRRMGNVHRRFSNLACCHLDVGFKGEGLKRRNGQNGSKPGMAVLFPSTKPSEPSQEVQEQADQAPVTKAAAWLAKLEAAEQRAVVAEDFDEANRLKLQIEELTALESKRSAAIQARDYDAAKIFTQEVNSLLPANGAEPDKETDDEEPSEPISPGPAEVQSEDKIPGETSPEEEQSKGRKPVPLSKGAATYVDIKIVTHRNMEKEKGFKPRLTLEVISETPGVPSVGFDATEWGYEQVQRQTGEVEGFGDLGAVFCANVELPAGFGTPGALLIQKQVYSAGLGLGGALVGALGFLSESPLDGLLNVITEVVDPEANHRIYISRVSVGDVTFHCHSAVHEKQGKRVFFSADAKLPKDTPEPVAELRRVELLSIQGRNPDGSHTVESRHQRKGPDRIYDYQTYNDLGDAVRSPDLERPNLGGSEEFPFPRRMRTGRPEVNGYELRLPKQQLGFPIQLPWMPYDEQFNKTKTFGFVGDELRAGINQIPSKIGSLFHNLGDKYSYRSLHAVDALFTEPSAMDSRNGIVKLKQADKVFDKLNDFWQASKFKLPRVRRNRQMVCFTDAEFGRQYLAGQNPCILEQVTPEWLAATPFDSKSIGGRLEGKTLEERLQEGNRLFQADYTHPFGDYIERINAQKKAPGTTDIKWLTKDRVQHAGRALFYFTDNGSLMPVAIELQKVAGEAGTVYTPYDTAELWQLAKEIISSMDCGFHQLVSHYLRAHACQEPFLIATMRHLSALHPVYKLMLPHFRYTMHINTNARSILINADGTLENIFTSGRYTMELASWVYKHVYRFDHQNLETDMVLRGMANQDEDTGRLKPVIDYPFGEDGLDIWYAMRDWFGSYLAIYYTDDQQLAEDSEIQEWWRDVREKGHPDKKEGWPALSTVTDLRDILTTIAFTGSAHHAAVNFGQYDYSGYMPNRPSLIRRPIPEKGSPAVRELQENYEEELLSYLPNPDDSLASALLYAVLSSHAPNEEYLDHEKPEWIEDKRALAAHEKFLAALKKLDADIIERNSPQHGSKIRGVVGARGIPYELLRPHSKEGVTSRGIPCSTSI
ncbi:Lipoxygenase 2.3, chloroplastic [Coccomyxa sp. Obi]|nr:Lipoxygenase 2.3, chloroplastic [Coccomyxa sp. Obi]